MSRKSLMLLGVCVYLSMLVCGCGQEADLSMRFTGGETSTYLVSTKSIKDFKFEQPSLDPPKLKEEQTATEVSVEFVQKIEKLDGNSGAIANITIKEVSYLVKDKGVVKFEFDSSNADHKGKSFAKVIGTSYTINISPTGKVAVVNASNARGAVAGTSYDAKVAKALFSDESIAKRHEILSLPDAGSSSMKANDSWSRIVASPPQLLAPKSYAKVYTVSSIDGPKGGEVATVVMTGAESAEEADDLPTNVSSMGPFSKMFDTTDDYTGKLVMEAGTGKIKSNTEKLIVTYIAAESPPNQKPDVGPDTLTMRFTYSTNLQLVD